jgi:hypothetical protein
MSNSKYKNKIYDVHSLVLKSTVDITTDPNHPVVRCQLPRWKNCGNVVFEEGNDMYFSLKPPYRDNWTEVRFLNFYIYTQVQDVSPETYPVVNASLTSISSYFRMPVFLCCENAPNNSKACITNNKHEGIKLNLEQTATNINSDGLRCYLSMLQVEPQGAIPDKSSGLPLFTPVGTNDFIQLFSFMRPFAQKTVFYENINIVLTVEWIADKRQGYTNQSS